MLEATGFDRSPASRSPPEELERPPKLRPGQSERLTERVAARRSSATSPRQGKQHARPTGLHMRRNVPTKRRYATFESWNTSSNGFPVALTSLAFGATEDWAGRRAKPRSRLTLSTSTRPNFGRSNRACRAH